MPSVKLHGPSENRAAMDANPLPQLLQTPSGLAVLEIQGTLNAPAPNAADGEFDQESKVSPVGRLAFPLYNANNPPEDTTWHKRVHLYIGKHQRMTGEVKKLVKPLALIQKRSGNGASETSDLEVVEIVHYKLLFAHRPEPVGTAIS
ncbi:hypothetical protein MBLNU230_g2842t1 [Neophaeotheca triangularis]